VRRAVNENPVVQAALVGVLVLVFAVFLYTRVLSGESESASSEPGTAESATSTTAPATPTGSAVAPETGVAPSVPAVPAAPAAPAAPTSPEGAIPPEGLEASKGLPASVVKAYEADKAIVLLIVRESGVEDRIVKLWVKALRSHPEALEDNHGLAVFVTGAKHISHYSRITLGVDVNRVPALVVVRPKSLSGDVPQATVRYGFRGPDSVLQAVRDALYKGPDDIPYYPD
jgi:hypothetical protein